MRKLQEKGAHANLEQEIRVTAREYKAEREQRGTQSSVAALLDVRQMTISDRENGVVPIHREAWLALLSLPKKRKKKP